MNEQDTTPDAQNIQVVPKHPGGRPLKFKTIVDLQAGIDDYFASVPKDEWTWTGLALHLDTSRETLREYKERPEYVDTLKRALLKVENQYEIDNKKHGRAGSIFALKNFGWHDKIETDVTTGGEKLGAITPIDPLLLEQWQKTLKQNTLGE